MFSFIDRKYQRTTTAPGTQFEIDTIEKPVFGYFLHERIEPADMIDYAALIIEVFAIKFTVISGDKYQIHIRTVIQFICTQFPHGKNTEWNIRIFTTGVLFSCNGQLHGPDDHVVRQMTQSIQN